MCSSAKIENKKINASSNNVNYSTPGTILNPLIEGCMFVAIRLNALSLTVLPSSFIVIDNYCFIWSKIKPRRTLKLESIIMQLITNRPIVQLITLFYIKYYKTLSL